jgi:hypothetical protein
LASRRFPSVVALVVALAVGVGLSLGVADSVGVGDSVAVAVSGRYKEALTAKLT